MSKNMATTMQTKNLFKVDILLYSALFLFRKVRHTQRIWTDFSQKKCDSYQQCTVSECLTLQC